MFIIILGVTFYYISAYKFQEAVSRLQTNWGKEEISKAMNDNFGLADLDIGPPIAKGCAAVVYSAALKDTSKLVASSDEMVTTTPPQSPQRQSPIPYRDMMSPIQNTSRFVHNFGGSVDNVNFNSTRNIELDLLASTVNHSSFIVDEYRRQSIQRSRFDSITESEYERAANNYSSSSSSSDENDHTQKVSFPQTFNIFHFFFLF